MKRPFSFEPDRTTALAVAGTCLIAATYGLVRLAYGLYLPDLGPALGLGDAAAGYVASGASVAYCVGAGLGVVAAHRPRWLVLGALATACLGSLGMAVAPDVAVFAPAAVVSSAGAGLASPAMVAIVARSVPAGRADRSQAVVNSGTGPGLVAAGLLALALLPSWRAGFVVAAAATALAGAAVLLLDRGDRPTAPAGPATPAGRDPLAGRDPVAGRACRDPLAWRPLLVPALAAALLGTASAVVWTYGRTLVVDAGLGGGASTAVWTAIGVGGAATVLTAPTQAALGPTRAWMLTTAVVAAAVLGLGLGAGSLPAALVAAAGFGWGFVAATSALIVWAGVALPGRGAEGTSVLFVALVLGQSAGSAAAGAVADGLGLVAAYVLLAGVAVLAAACGRAPGSTPPAGTGVPRAEVRRVDMDA